MPAIGTFTLKDGKWTGTIRTLSMNVKAQFVPNNSDATDAPAYRLFAGGAELGAAWKATATDSGTEYLSVRLDDPFLPKPVRMAFFFDEDDESGRLVWSRPKPQDEMLVAAE